MCLHPLGAIYREGLPPQRTTFLLHKPTMAVVVNMRELMHHLLHCQEKLNIKVVGDKILQYQSSGKLLCDKLI